MTLTSAYDLDLWWIRRYAKTLGRICKYMIRPLNGKNISTKSGENSFDENTRFSMLVAMETKIYQIAQRCQSGIRRILNRETL